MEWCKLEILRYYIDNQHSNKFKWLLYLDADTHFIKFNTSFNQWMEYIHQKYRHYVDDMDNIHFLLTNDTPRFIQRELPRLQNMMKPMDGIKGINYGCDTYGNAGVLFLKNSNISLSMLNEWSKSINSIPSRMILNFERTRIIKLFCYL